LSFAVASLRARLPAAPGAPRLSLSLAVAGTATGMRYAATRDERRRAGDG